MPRFTQPGRVKRSSFIVGILVVRGGRSHGPRVDMEERNAVRFVRRRHVKFSGNRYQRTSSISE